MWSVGLFFHNCCCCCWRTAGPMHIVPTHTDTSRTFIRRLGIILVIGDRQQIQPRGPTIICSALPARCVILGCSSGIVCVGVINEKQRSMRKSKSSVGPLLRATPEVLVSRTSRVISPFSYYIQHPDTSQNQLYHSHNTFHIKLFRTYTSGSTKAKMPTMYNVRTTCYLPLRYLC